MQRLARVNRGGGLRVSLKDDKGQIGKKYAQPRGKQKYADRLHFLLPCQHIGDNKALQDVSHRGHHNRIQEHNQIGIHAGP